MLNKLNLNVSTTQSIKVEGENERNRAETIEYLSRNHWEYMVTLSFVGNVNETTAQWALDKFIKRLNIKTFAKRSKKSVILVPALETCKSGAYHVHLLIKDPTSRIENEKRRATFDLKATIRECWESVGRMTANVMKSCPDGSSWFKPVTDSEGAVRYITKEITKGNRCVIQFDQYRPDGRRIYP